MKDLVLLPLKFVAMLAVLLSLCVGFQVVVDYALMSRELHDHFPTLVYGIVISTVNIWFFPVLGLSTIMLLSGIFHRRYLFGWHLLLLFILLSGAVFGVLSASKLPALSPAPAKAYDFNIPEKTILPFEKGFIFILHDQSAKAKGVLFHTVELNGRFEVIPDAVKNAKTRQLVIGARGISIPVNQIMKVRADPFLLPAILMSPIELLERSTANIQKTVQPSWLQTLILSGSLAFAFTGLWFFIRMTRWPLFNVLIGLVVLFGLLLLATALSNQVIISLFSFIPSQLKMYLLPMTFGLCGLLMFGWTFFLPSLRELSPGTAL